jgi:hypothetical protein
MLTTVFTKRFCELEAKLKAFRLVPNSGGRSGSHIATAEWKQWATSAESLILAVYGENDPHTTYFRDSVKNCAGYDYDIEALKGLFLSAKEDFDGGYVFNVDLRISGEVFGDFVTLARTALSEGRKDVAAVLACAALEDALKRFAKSNDLISDDKSMTEVVAALKSAGFVAGAQKSLLDAMPRIRNHAMHAEWGKLSEPDVSSVIGFVEQFLTSKFGGG